jgi:diguanylate cyclase (GGDEF)-like protein
MRHAALSGLDCRVPREAPAVERPPANRVNVFEIAQPMATILIVDSPRSGPDALMDSLGRFGHRVLQASSGEMALRIARAESPDLVLTDERLPDMDGCQLIMRLRAEPGTARRQVVFQVHSGDAQGREQARACGADHVITRPDGPDALVRAIDEALASRSPAPLPVPGADGALRPLVGRLRHKVTELETLTSRMSERMEETQRQLDAARAALEQEVKKRIWAERELTQANMLLRDRAVRDPLTGLHNRGYLEESLAREESRARRTGQPLGVMMIDIDHFKQCNDTFGHAAGDAVLRAVSHYVLSLTRGEDIFCRYGGEEFVLVMVNSSARGVWERAETLCSGVRALRVEHEGRVIGPITLSIGIGMIPDHAEKGQAAMLVADAALYRAKQEGRDRVVMGSKA